MVARHHQTERETPMPTGSDDQRRYIRYSHRDQGMIMLVRVSAEGAETATPALLVDESHTGLRCVLVGPPPSDDEIFFHDENAKIRTGLVLRHHQEVAPTVRILGFEVTD